MISAETLAAYADGELSDAGAAEVEAAINADPVLRARLEDLKSQRDFLSAHYDTVLDEPVPEHFHRLLSQSPSDTPQNRRQKFDLASRLGEIADAVFATRWAGGLTAAACLVLGFFIGGQVFSTPASSGYGDHGGALYAQGELERVLSVAASGEAVSATVPVMSFTSTQDTLCRAFVSSSASGVACRTGGRWRMEALELQQANPAGSFRTASTALPPSVLAAVDRLMTGDVLDPEAERLALDAVPQD